jgi:hypothetical protein
MVKRRRHTPEQIVRKLREADRLLAEALGTPDASPAGGARRARSGEPPSPVLLGLAPPAEHEELQQPAHRRMEEGEEHGGAGLSQPQIDLVRAPIEFLDPTHCASKFRQPSASDRKRRLG